MTAPNVEKLLPVEQIRAREYRDETGTHLLIDGVPKFTEINAEMLKKPYVQAYLCLHGVNKTVVMDVKDFRWTENVPMFAVKKITEHEAARQE